MTIKEKIILVNESTTDTTTTSMSDEVNTPENTEVNSNKPLPSLVLNTKLPSQTETETGFRYRFRSTDTSTTNMSDEVFTNVNTAENANIPLSNLDLNSELTSQTDTGTETGFMAVKTVTIIVTPEFKDIEANVESVHDQSGLCGRLSYWRKCFNRNDFLYSLILGLGPTAWDVLSDLRYAIIIIFNILII